MNLVKMFESDDFDQVLSQYSFPDLASSPKQVKQHNLNDDHEKNYSTSVQPPVVSEPNTEILDENHENRKYTDRNDNMMSKHAKRKLLNSYFDSEGKRKFPGPAGLLTGTLLEPKDHNICQMELLSQDVDFTENSLRRHLFDSPIWTRLLEDIKTWNLNKQDCIKTIKQEALAPGNLRRWKAHTVIAFVDSVDRSGMDPLIILRDTTGSIKCTLHRDAWTTFSSYIVAEYCALVLSRPTVLTTGSAFKKHYLNITLSNILAIYSSAILTGSDNDTEKTLPEGYTVSNQDFTVIKLQPTQENTETDSRSPNNSNMNSDLFEDLDGILLDDLF